MEKHTIGILNKNIPEDVKDKLSTISDSIDETIEFGTQILAWDLSRKGDDTDLPAIMFLRNMIENLDAIGILIRHSSIEPCKILLRTALENYCSIEYLLKDPAKAKQRALCFLVWNFIEHGKWLHRVDKTSKEYRDIKANFLKDKLMKASEPLVVEDAKLKISGLENLLNSEPYKGVKKEYDLKHGKKRNPAWYSLYGGPDSLYAVAQDVELPALYKVLYRGWSHSTHGNNTVQGKLKNDGTGFLEIEQLRSPNDSGSIAQHCTNLAIAAYMIYIDKRMPDRKGELRMFYEKVRGVKLSLVK